MTIVDLLDQPMSILHQLFKLAFDTSVAEKKRREKEEKERKMKEQNGKRKSYNPGGLPQRYAFDRSPIDEMATNRKNNNESANINISNSDMEELMDELE